MEMARLPRAPRVARSNMRLPWGGPFQSWSVSIFSRQTWWDRVADAPPTSPVPRKEDARTRWASEAILARTPRRGSTRREPLADVLKANFNPNLHLNG